MNPQSARSAIEGLRSGVPNRAVVELLGVGSTQLHEAFVKALEAKSQGLAAEPILFQGPFGTGKSHLLLHWRAVAEAQGFATTQVVIGPETPLGNPNAVQRAVSEAARAPGTRGKAIKELAARAPAGAAARLGTLAAEAGVSDRFRALARIYETTQDEDLRNDVLNDLEGRPVSVGRVRKALREIKEADRYSFGAGTNAAHAHERIVLAALFCQAHGLRGLVVLFDELERLTAFGPRSRQAAYQELGWWRTVGLRSDVPIVAVFASADNAHHRFQSKRETARLSAPEADGEDKDLAGFGHALFDAVEDLEPIVNDAEAMRRLRQSVENLYLAAYGFAPQAGVEPGVHKTVRAALRHWITEWDMARFHVADPRAITNEALQFGKESFGDEDLAAISDEGS